MTTLVIDTGMSIVGIYSVDDHVFVAYRGNRIAEAIERIQSADEVVTYNGCNNDLKQLGKFAGIEDGDLPINGDHVDMQAKCWEPIVGTSLLNTYCMHFDLETSVPDPPFCPSAEEEERERKYELGNQCDVYMTLKLWELWKADKLRLMGYGYTHHSNGGWR